MEARAIQSGVRQSARKMRLVIDLIRGRAVPEADAILRFSKKRAAHQIHKVLKSAVANAQQAAQRQNAPFDADALRVSYAVVNEGQTLKRFTAAAMGRGTPILKRTSHVEIRVAGADAPVAKAPAAAGTAPKAEAEAGQKGAGGEGQEEDDGEEKESERVSGSENTSIRLPAGHRQTVAVPLFREAQLPGAAQGRRADPQVSEDAAQPRGDRRRAHRAQARQGDGHRAHRAARRGHRQARRG